MINKESINNKIIQNNGKLLSNFIDNKTKIKCECHIGHIFNIMPKSLIRNNSWCNKCSFKSEEICRLFISLMFNNSFNKIKMKDIKSNKNYSLELDGYNKELNIAFEHQGTQHYKDIYNNAEKFKRLQENDLLKIKRCKELGIKLIVIPGLNYKLKESNLRQFILDKCNELNVICPNPNVEINYNLLQTNNFLIKCQNYAINKGGKCLSNKVLFTNDNVIWKCINNHVWISSHNNTVTDNRWCLKCKYINQTLNINDAIIIGEKYNLTCLSLSCNGQKDYLHWRCNNCKYIFKDSIYKLNDRHNVCSNCKIYNFCVKYNLTFLFSDINNKLHWKCNSCNYNFTGGIAKLSYKKNICLNCKRKK